MPKYRVRNADSYGHAVGILLLDYRGPFIPGDVGNATTYRYPVLFKVVKGLTFDRVLAADKEISKHVGRKELEQMCDPANYLGLAGEMVDRVLAREAR